jgi:hypothetical protein
LKATSQAIINIHHCSTIVKLSTVVWCGEDCDQLSLIEKFIPILYHLMSSTDEVQLVFFQEVCDDVSPKNVTDSSFGFTPTFDAGIRISPKEIAE